MQKYGKGSRNDYDSILSTEPKDPPKNVVVSVIPEEVNRVKVTFTPPEEPNGNITAYFVYVYEKDKLVKNVSLNITKRDQNMMTAVIEGLKGGHSYSIQVYTLTGMCNAFSTHFQNVFLRTVNPFGFFVLHFLCNQSYFPHFDCLQISAKNGAGRSPPSPHVQITTGIKGMGPFFLVCSLQSSAEFLPLFWLQQCGLNW